MYKLILFDLDGTLLNTVPDICAVLNTTLKEFSIKPVTIEETMEYVGDGAFKLVERAAGNIDGKLLDKVFVRYVKLFSECDNGLSSLYPDEEEVLSKLTSAGIKLAIVTNKPQRATENVYKKYFEKYKFVAVRGQSEGVPLKPDPTVILSLIEKSGAGRADCLFVGDGEADVQAAKKAGIDCVSVLWGYRNRAQLKRAGASVFAENFKSLEKLVLNKKPQ